VKPSTPLPWRFALDSYGVQRIWGVSHGETCDIASTEGDGSIPYAEREQNAHYIVHACNAYPRLIEALKAIEDHHNEDDSWRGIARALLKELEE